jgi:hypothetical protein
VKRFVAMLALPDVFKDMTGLVLGDRNTHYSFLRLRFCIFEHTNDNDICDTIHGIFLKPFRRSSAFTTMMYLNTLIGRFKRHDVLVSDGVAAEMAPKVGPLLQTFCIIPVPGNMAIDVTCACQISV